MNQKCKVCGEPAAGFHFGAFTCEGCKSFFGRTYSNMSSISECKNNNECIIDKKNRTSCKACRLKKCLLVGMSKSGSRYGRRSNWFKIHCLLQEQASNSTHSTNGFPSSGYTPNGLYASGFLPHPLRVHPPDKIFPSPLNGVCESEFKRIKLENGAKNISSSEESRSSSVGTEEESRSPSVLSFLRPPSSHHSTSPFSEKDCFVNHKRLSATVTPNTTPDSPGSAFSSVSPSSSYTSSSHFFSSQCTPQSGVPFKPLPSRCSPIVTGLFPHGNTGLTPINRNHIFVDYPNHTSSMGTGGDLLLRSPALAGVAVEQEQPIDLSVKSSSLECSNYSLSSAGSEMSGDRSRHNSPGVREDKKSSVSEEKHTATPLDLTSKRPVEVEQSS